jgi:hypothetical protein
MKSSLAVFLTGLFFLPMVICGQDANKTVDITRLDTRISDFVLDDESILVGVQRLNSENLQIGFGFEKVLTRRFAAPPVPYPQVSIKLKNPSTREALDALCAADTRYTWSVDGSTVNVYPASITRDPAYLLNRKLDQLTLQGITDLEQGLFAIPKQLPGPLEQIAHAQAGGDTSFPAEPWSVTFKGVTVRQAINRLAEHMGPSSSWVFGGSDEFRRFAFYRGGFHPQLGLSGRPVADRMVAEVIIPFVCIREPEFPHRALAKQLVTTPASHQRTRPVWCWLGRSWHRRIAHA